MSYLIDSFNDGSQQNVNGRWYMAKPCFMPYIWERCKDAWQVLIGKAIAVHFKVDEKEGE